MNSSDFYTETLKLQRQAAQEQTSIITEIKNTFAGAEAAEANNETFNYYKKYFTETMTSEIKNALGK